MRLSKATFDEINILRGLARHRDLDWAQVSGPTLRYLLACVRIQDVLDATEAYGVESPLSTATDLANAEHAADAAAKESP